MQLNLVTDSWLPVIRNGRADTIRPDQIAESGVEWPNWPRPDLNLACLELLVGLVYLADPPRNTTDWLERRPEPDRLREAMAPLAPAFNLLGDGPRFLQDLEHLEGKVNGPDFLFVDSSGAQTTKNNADLTVKRGRYPALSKPMAAVALYALQGFAPSGGAGNRTSMRGGGPMVTLVRPEQSAPTALWNFIWANVPRGEPVRPGELDQSLPWMRPTRTSEEGATTNPPDIDFVPPETFFGMPRRLRLEASDDGLMVTGVIQKNYGANYEGWIHPLSPYYSTKEGGEKLPRHPKPGSFGYRNWLGVLLDARDGTSFRAVAVHGFQQHRRREQASVLVGGWAMDNMKPLDFVWSEQPLFALDEAAEEAAVNMVGAAEMAAKHLVIALRKALGVAKAGTSLVSRAQEEFFESTQAPFEIALASLSELGWTDDAGYDWLKTLNRAAESIFDGLALPGLSDRDVVEPRGGESAGRKPNAKSIVEARRAMRRALRGKKMLEILGLPEKTPAAGNREAA